MRNWYLPQVDSGKAAKRKLNQNYVNVIRD